MNGDNVNLLPTAYRPATKREKAIAYAVKQKVEAAVRAQIEADSQASKRREAMRKVYRRIFPGDPAPVDFATVREIIDSVAGSALNGWRKLSSMDHVAMAAAGTREDFDEFEFLINRTVYTLSAIRDTIAQAKNFSETAKQKGMKP